jgi:hypothetical protein
VLTNQIIAWLQQTPAPTAAEAEVFIKKRRLVAETDAFASVNSRETDKPPNAKLAGLCRDADVTDSVFGVGGKKPEVKDEKPGSATRLAAAMGAPQPGLVVANPFSFPEPRPSLLPSRPSVGCS